MDFSKDNAKGYRFDNRAKHRGTAGDLCMILDQDLNKNDRSQEAAKTARTCPEVRTGIGSASHVN